MENNFNQVFGLGEEISCFSDGKARVATPVTMRNFAKFLVAFTQINTEKMWVNFLFDENQNAMKEVLKMTFLNDDVEQLIDLINPQNFTLIFGEIQKLNGIEIPKEDDEKN